MRVAIICLILVIIGIIYCYNRLIRGKMQIKNAKSTIDVFLKKRFDLIPNLIEVVKGYSNYESDLMVKLTSIRSKYESQSETKEQLGLDAEYQDSLAIAENYPDLKANQTYLELQRQLESLEDELQAARRFYNSAVTKYNIDISVIPLNIFANIFKFKEAELFETTEEEKQKIKVKI